MQRGNDPGRRPSRFEFLAGGPLKPVWLKWDVANVAASAPSCDLNRQLQKKCESGGTRGVSGSLQRLDTPIFSQQVVEGRGLSTSTIP